MKLRIVPEGRALGLNADEFFDACRILRPGLTREEFEEYWQDFQREKAERNERRQVC